MRVTSLTAGLEEAESRAVKAIEHLSSSSSMAIADARDEASRLQKDVQVMRAEMTVSVQMKEQVETLLRLETQAQDECGRLSEKLKLTQSELEKQQTLLMAVREREDDLMTRLAKTTESASEYCTCHD